MKAPVLFLSLMAVACGQATPTSTAQDSAAQPAKKGTCETFAAASDLAAERSVNPLTENVSAMELAMIQQAVLSTNDTPVTPSEALDIFTDKENDGSLGGQIEYFKLQVDGSEKNLAKAVYYPGDNEYGMLFQIYTYQDGSQSSYMVGKIGDSDIYCLTAAQ